MKRHGKKALSILLSILMIMSVLTTAFTAFAAETVINIIHTNDMHGALEDLSYVKGMKDTLPNAILLDAGDSTQGSSLVTYTQGLAAIELMNDVGYDGMALGNHEFDYGAEIALKNAKAAKFPVVAANVKNSEGKLFLADDKNNGKYFIVEEAGIKIGVFGLTTVETAFKTNPAKLNGTTFESEVETAKAVVAELKEEGVDLIVALGHVGIDETSEITSHEIADEVEGIDLFIDGHSHSEDTYVSEKTGCVVNQTGTKLANVGLVQITVTDNGNKIEAGRVTAEEYKAEYKADEDVAAKYQEKQDALQPLLDVKAGESTTPIFAFANGSIRVTRMEETPGGSLVADAMKAQAEEMLKALGYDYKVVALQNGGGVRADLPQGDVTVGDILNVLPFGNTIQIVEATPADLYTAFENGVAGLKYDSTTGYQTTAYAALCVVAGVEILVDLSAKSQVVTDGKITEDGNRIVSITLVDGETRTTLDRADTKTKLALVSNDFELSGGDNYVSLAGLKKITEGGPLDLALQDYIASLVDEDGKFTYCTTSGRVKFVQQPYESKVNIVIDKEFEAGKEYTVAIDGGKAVKVKADEKGQLVLVDVAFGAHTVQIDEEFLFVSTVTGTNVKDIAGDINSDGAVSMIDVVLLQQHLAELIKLSDGQITRADVAVEFGKLSMVDVVTIQKYIAKLIEVLPDVPAEEDTDTEVEVDTETKVDTEVEVNTEADTEAEVDTEVEVNTEVDTEAEVDTESEVDTEETVELVTLDEANKLQPGDKVRTRGQVVYIYAGTTVIIEAEDESGSVKGFQIYDKAGITDGKYPINTLIEVEGEISVYNGLNQVQAPKVTVLEENCDPIEPIKTLISDLDAFVPAYVKISNVKIVKIDDKNSKLVDSLGYEVNVFKMPAIEGLDADKTYDVCAATYLFEGKVQLRVANASDVTLHGASTDDTTDTETDTETDTDIDTETDTDSDEGTDQTNVFANILDVLRSFFFNLK